VDGRMGSGGQQARRGGPGIDGRVHAAGQEGQEEEATPPPQPPSPKGRGGRKTQSGAFASPLLFCLLSCSPSPFGGGGWGEGWSCSPSPFGGGGWGEGLPPAVHPHSESRTSHA